MYTYNQIETAETFATHSEVRGLEEFNNHW